MIIYEGTPISTATKPAIEWVRNYNLTGGGCLLEDSGDLFTIIATVADADQVTFVFDGSEYSCAHHRPVTISFLAQKIVCDKCGSPHYHECGQHGRYDESGALVTTMQTLICLDCYYMWEDEA